MDNKYGDLFIRNSGYVSSELQEKIYNTKILIAGCGMGSSIAETAARIGFQHITLIDGDTIEEHNLNRQLYNYEDIGEYKVKALGKRLRAINPKIEVKEIADWLKKENVVDLVKEHDFIFDSIDFLDLSAITLLHDEANIQNKPIISAVNAGWGAASIYIPPAGSGVSYFRKIFKLPDEGPVDNESYVGHFSLLIDKIADDLDPDVVKVMNDVFEIMKEGKPCPAPQTSPGSYSTGALAVTMVTRVLEGKKVVEAPYLVLVDLSKMSQEGGISLL